MNYKKTPHSGENVYTDNDGKYKFVFSVEEDGEELLWENIEVYSNNNMNAFNISSKTQFQNIVNSMK